MHLVHRSQLPARGWAPDWLNRFAPFWQGGWQSLAELADWESTLGLSRATDFRSKFAQSSTKVRPNSHF